MSGIGGSAKVGDGLNSNDIATRLADALGGTFEGIYAPAYAEDKETRNRFIRHADINRALDRARRADVAIVGIGDVVPTSLVVRLGCISVEEMGRLREDGAVGDILGSFVNSGGVPIAEWIEDRIIGLTRDDIHHIPTVIAAASEASKAPAILGALHSGMVDILVLPVMAAREVLSLAENTAPGRAPATRRSS